MTYEEMMVQMKVEGISPKKKEALWVKDIFRAKQLCQHMEVLYTRYPVLGFRPFKAATYVSRNEVWINPFLEGTSVDGVFAEVRRSDNTGGHLVGVTPTGVYFCDCPDFRYNVRPVAVLEGPRQQPCCHILAVALNDVKILAKFIDLEVLNDG